MTRYFQNIQEYLSNFFFEFTLKAKVCFENHNGVQNVRVQIIERLTKSLKISVSDEEQSDVKVVFCPIVSRAGTDIEATLSRLSPDKPTIVLVLHHTFNPEYNAPNSSRYDGSNLMMVDILFHENLGLLHCSKNNKAISKAGNYLKEYSKGFLRVVRVKRVLAVSVSVSLFCWLIYIRKIGHGVLPA